MMATRPERKTGVQILGAITAALIEWINKNQFNTINFLGGAADLNKLLDSLNYKPDYVVWRMWFGTHELNAGDKVVVVDPNHFDGLAEWALNTNEYGNHKNPVTGEIARAEYGNEWNIVWEWGSHQPQRMLLKWLSWVRGELQQVSGRDNVYVMSFIAGLEGQQVTREYMLFERERVAVLAESYDLKSVVGNIAAGRYLDDQAFWDWSETEGLMHTMLAYGAPWGLHGYAYMTLMNEQGDFQVTNGNDPNSLTPKDPIEYVRERKQYPGDMLGSWAAYGYRRPYHLKIAPKGFGELKIILTEYYLDKPPKDRQRAMVEKYLNDQIPANFWELSHEPPNEPSHWRRLGFLDKHLAILRDRGEPESFAVAAQMFAGEDLAWGENELQSSGEVLGACVYMGRLDGVTGESSWENYNVANTAIFPDYFEEGLARLQSGEPDPDPDPEPDPEPQPEAPNAGISGPLTVKTGEAATFQNETTGDVASIKWIIDGGEVLDEDQFKIVIRWNTPGSRIVALTATGSTGLKKSAQHTVIVSAVEQPEPEPEPEPQPNIMSGLPLPWVAFIMVMQLVSALVGAFIASL